MQEEHGMVRLWPCGRVGGSHGGRSDRSSGTMPLDGGWDAASWPAVIQETDDREAVGYQMFPVEKSMSGAKPARSR